MVRDNRCWYDECKAGIRSARESVKFSVEPIASQLSFGNCPLEAWTSSLTIMHIFECGYYLLLFWLQQFLRSNSRGSFRHISQFNFISVVAPVPTDGRRLVCEKSSPIRTPMAGPDDDRLHILRSKEKSSPRLRRIVKRTFEHGSPPNRPHKPASRPPQQANPIFKNVRSILDWFCKYWDVALFSQVPKNRGRTMAVAMDGLRVEPCSKVLP
jgi:hypothetical protein